MSEKKIYMRSEVLEYLIFLKNNKVVDENVKKKKYGEIVGSEWSNRNRVFSRVMRFEEILKKESVLDVCKKECEESKGKGKRISMLLKI